jgi:hypothetical protein
VLFSRVTCAYEMNVSLNMNLPIALHGLGTSMELLCLAHGLAIWGFTIWISNASFSLEQ